LGRIARTLKAQKDGCFVLSYSKADSKGGAIC